MVAQALDAIRAVFHAEVASVVELHFIGEIAAFFRDGVEAEGHAKHKQPYNPFFHCSHS